MEQPPQPTKPHPFPHIQHHPPLPSPNHQPPPLTPPPLTTQVHHLTRTLRSPPHNLPTTTLSIDDLYLPHPQLLSLACAHPENPLIQHRGQPSTHDLPLALRTFASLRAGLPTRIPAFDKSAFCGQGERVPECEWEVVNRVEEGEEGRVKVVIYEGWCVGFRALEEGALRGRWEEAVRRPGEEEGGGGGGAGGRLGRLGRSRYEDVRFVNEALRGYDALTEYVERFPPLPSLVVSVVVCYASLPGSLAIQHRLTPSLPVRPLASLTPSSTCKSPLHPIHPIPHRPPPTARTHALTSSPPASDALHMTDVYAWRQDQERALRALKGTGMSDEQVIRFVDGCTFHPSPLPSYPTSALPGVKEQSTYQV